METHATLKKYLFIATVAAALLVLFWTLFLNFSNVQYGVTLRINTDEGYLFIDGVDAGGAAAEAGVRKGDRVLVVNGQDLSALDVGALRVAAERISGYPRVELLLEREGEEFSVYIEPVSVLPDAYFLLVAFTAALYIGMGAWVFFARPNYPAANAWGYFSVLISGFVLLMGHANTEIGSMGFLFSVLLVSELLFGVTAGLHFALVFPRKSSLVKKRWFIPALYLVPATVVFLLILFIVSVFAFPGFQPYIEAIGNTIGGSIMGLFSIYMALMVAVLLFTYLSNDDASERRRIRLIIFGTALPLSAVLAFVILGNFFAVDTSNAEFLLLIALIIVPFTYLYAIVRYRAMQIELILKRGLIYSLLTGTVVILAGILFIAVFGLVLLLQDVLPGLLGREGSAFHQLATDQNVQKFMIAVMAVFIGATVGSLKKWVQAFVDRRFYRERHSYKKALESLSAVISQTHDLDHMTDMVLRSAEDIVHPRTACFVIFEQEGTATVRSCKGDGLKGMTLKKESVEAIRKLFSGNAKFLSLRELNEENFENGELLHASMKRLKADMLIPFKNRNRVLGVLSLGKKLSETSYNTEDLKMLQMLTGQAALGLEHINLALEAAEKEKLKRELAIGRLMQERMLPTAIPEFPGMQIAALNHPAREVSGDFYTWVDNNDGKLGVIVGDIVGKGVAGALSMAAIISTLTLIAEDCKSVDSALNRLNRYLVKNWPKRSFAAITFALINPAKQVFTWSNGGLPDPIYIPANGEPRYLESARYPLPPGASAHSVYGGNSLHYQQGDAIIIFTDGAVEVSSPDGGEVLGYEGLLEFAGTVRGHGAMDLVDAISGYVHAFREEAVLDDDLTAVAIRFKETS